MGSNKGGSMSLTKDLICVIYCLWGEGTGSEDVLFKWHPSPSFELREYVTGPISFVQIHTTHQGSLVVQAISLVWMELAMFGVAAVVYVASGVLHGYLGLFGDWAYPERWSCPGNMAWMHYKSQLSQEAIWTMKIPTICGRTCFTQSCTERWIP